MPYTTKINIKVKGFTVPDYLSEHIVECAVPRSPLSAAPLSARTFNLSEIPAETLNDMCNAFKREIFRRAGKTMPAVGGSGPGGQGHG